MAFNQSRSESECQIESVIEDATRSEEQWVDYITKKINNKHWDALCVQTTWPFDGTVH